MSLLHRPLYTMLLLFQLALLLLLLLIDDNILFFISAVFLILVGIPHGAVDVLHRHHTRFKKLSVFLAVYISVILLYALLWFWLPVLALLLFMGISVVHFGETVFESKQWFGLKPMLWGLLFILIPVTIHMEEAFAIFADMTSVYTVSNVQNTFYVISGALLLVHLVYVFMTEERKFFALLLLQWILLILWFWFTPLLEGFLMAFVLWHALPSLYQQREVYERSGSANSVVFWMTMLVYTCFAAALLALMAYFFELTPAFLFVLLSLITLPHALVIHKTMPDA